jgi:hypothetical protein
VLDELESHLRDDAQAQMQTGSEAPQAFASAVQRLGPAGALRAEFEQAGVPTARTESPWMLVTVICLGIFYLAVSTYALIKHDPSAGERMLGFLALAFSVAIGFGAYRLAGWLFAAAGPRTTKAIRFGMPCLGAAWLLSFVLLILPRCDFEPAGLVVSLLWSLAPLCATSGADLALNRIASKSRATAGS